MTSAETPHVPVIPLPRYFFAVSLAATIFFAVWTSLVHGKALPAFDERCAEYWHEYNSGGHTLLWEFMVFLTDLGGVASMTLLAIMGGIWQTAIKHRVLTIAWFGVVIGGGLINMGSKATFDRDRPREALRDRAVLETNKSYPSGHSMGSAIGYGMLAYALVLPQRRRPRRIVAVTLLSCLVLAIGFSRIYLRAHWFSDVVGGWTIGVAWVSFCVGWLEYRRRRAAHTGTVGHSSEPEQARVPLSDSKKI
jgi:undecaprenyl-diphosphatase